MDETTRPDANPTASEPSRAPQRTAAGGSAGSAGQMGPIVVGVDGSKESRIALRWALSEAHVRGCAVLAVSVWHLYPLAPPERVGASPWWFTADPEEATRAFLGEVVDEVAADFPDVTVEQRVVSGHAAEQLIALSSEADVLVLGATGSGGFVGMRLGSVARAVLEHALCTVVVAR
jgi:nucleotide-binding universal stress UspA family protein